MKLPHDWEVWLAERLHVDSDILVGRMVELGLDPIESAYMVLKTKKEVVILNDSPRIELRRNFFASWECDLIVGLEELDWFEALSYSPADKEIKTSAHKKCMHGHIYSYHHPAIRELEHRVSAAAGVDVACTEGFISIKYEEGGVFGVHTDSYDVGDPEQAEFIGDKGNRVATCIVYLNTVEEGGGTHFPEFGITVEAKKGDLLIFRYPNNDISMRHQGLEVVKGTKQILNKWVRENPFNQQYKGQVGFS